MNHDRFIDFFKELLAYIIAIIPAYIIVSVLVSLELFIHEFGHITFGFLTNLLHGYEGSFYFSNMIQHPLIPFIHLPQQTTTTGPVTGSYIFGGVLLMIVIWWFVSSHLFKKTKDRSYYLLFIIFLLFELSGNLICGTDNLTGKPLGLCIPLIKNLPTYLMYILIIFFAWKLKPYFLKKVKKFY